MTLLLLSEAVKKILFVAFAIMSMHCFSQDPQRHVDFESRTWNNNLVAAPNACSLVITNPPSACTPATVNLTLPAVTAGSAPGTLSYWTNAAATTPLANPASVSITGTYYIKTTNGTGCSDIKPVIVSVGGPPATDPYLTPVCPESNPDGSTLKFDFNNLGQTGFNINYTVNGGALVTVPYFTAPSNYTVNGLTSGDIVIFTVNWVGLCAAKTVTAQTRIVPTFSLPSGLCVGTALPVTSTNGIHGHWNPANIITVNGGTDNYVFIPDTYNSCLPTFIAHINDILPTATTFNTTTPSYCQNSTAQFPTNTNSPQVSGTWSPAVINTATVGASNYTFTPDPALFPCATQKQITVTITPRITPTFNAIPALCQNAIAPTLPASSTNTPPITGTWNAPISTAAAGTTVYTFTPNAGQCTSTALATLSITVNPNVTPNFAPIAPICSGTTPPVLATTSPNGITGTWSPATVSNTIPQNYTFTPASGQCGVPQILHVAILPAVHPNFNPTLALCSATPPPVLAGTSPNGITGTWSPAIIDNLANGIYVFTPAAGQCAESHTLAVTITPVLSPSFATLMTLCQNETPPALENVSPNGVAGSWSPSTIDTSVLGVFNYTFTSTPGQCASVTHPLQVTIQTNQTPDFAAIAPFCEGDVAPVLATTSPNGITGSWAPAVIDNMAIGTKPYTFTATTGQCSSNQILNITVTQKIIPAFTPIAAFCAGDAAPVLPLVSNNGITGTWLPATVDNTASANYFFQPDVPQCAQIKTLHITVNQPVDPDFPDFAICAGSTPPALGPLSPNGISGSWMPVVIDNNASASYVFTPNVSECANPQTVNVTVNQLTLNNVSWTVSNYFSGNPAITVLATDPGNYLYQLDFGPLQESNVFDHVGLGTHTITVSDVNGCSPSIAEDEVMVIGYPPFFTPNGDDFNDTWNIFTLSEQTGATIFIFDRYGKLLKQIMPNGPGWDGSYNGNPMPSSDYWFTVNFSENGEPRQFASHFTLKR